MWCRDCEASFNKEKGGVYKEMMRKEKINGTKEKLC